MRHIANTGAISLTLAWALLANAEDNKVRPELPKLPPEFSAEKMADRAAAEKAAEWLEKEYADKQSEAVRMLISVLRGRLSGLREGWFGPGSTVYSFDWLATKLGVDPKSGSISRDLLRVPEAVLERIDRDGDGRVTRADLDWSEQSAYIQQSALITRLFRRIDSSGDGRVSREELDEFFARMMKDKGPVTVDEFRNMLMMRGRTGMGMGPGGGGAGGTSIPMLVRSFLAEEMGSWCEGPKLGEAAPDFTLKSRDGKETVQLSKVIGPKPTVLLLGNFTCGPFRGFYPEVDAMRQRFKDQANFLMVYVREAHPADGWKMTSNERAGVDVKQPKTLEERAGVCDQFCQKLKPTMPVYVDDITDPVGRAYSGMPGRLYVIDPKGKVAYKSGRGPSGFKIGEMEQALALAILDSTFDKK